MTLVQTRSHPVDATPADREADRRADCATDTAAPRVGDDMTVEVALSVVISARTEHLLICDDDGLCTRLVTRAQLATVRDSSAYTDRIRLRDIPGDRGPSPAPHTPTASAGQPTGNGRSGTPPASAGQGRAPVVLAPV